MRESKREAGRRTDRRTGREVRETQAEWPTDCEGGARGRQGLPLGGEGPGEDPPSRAPPGLPGREVRWGEGHNGID